MQSGDDDRVRQDEPAATIKVLGITLGVWLVIIAAAVFLAWLATLLLGTQWHVSHEL